MKSFLKMIVEPVYATDQQRKIEIWDVEGRLKNGNQKFKFDLSPIIKFKEEDYGKVGHFKSKADKIVFEAKDHWIVFDTEELHEYIKSGEKRDFNVDELLNNLSWNLILDKVE